MYIHELSSNYLSRFISHPFMLLTFFFSCSKLWTQTCVRSFLKIQMSKSRMNNWIRISGQWGPGIAIFCRSPKMTVICSWIKNYCPRQTEWLPVPLTLPLTVMPPGTSHHLNWQRTYSSFWNSSTRLDFWPGDILAKMVPLISICKEPKRETFYHVSWSHMK